MSHPTTPEFSAYELPRRTNCVVTSPQPDWFVSPYSHHYAPQKPSPLASPPTSPTSLSDASSVGSSSDSEEDCSSSGSSIESPTTPLSPVSPWNKTHRRASESDYFSEPSRKVRFASLPFTPELNVPYTKPEGPLTPLWRLDEEDEEVLPTLKVSFKAMKEARKLSLPLHTPPAAPVVTKRPSLTDAPMLRIATLRRNSSMLAKQFTATPIPRRQRPFITLVTCLTLFCILLVISSVEQARYQTRVQGLAQASIATRIPNIRPIFMRRAMPAAAAVDAAKVEPFKMSAQDELAALISFMTGTVSNSLPAMDTSAPLDPEAILPFNPATASARSEMDEIVLETWDQHPLLVMGQMRDPLMVQTRRLLNEYRISPAPEYIELDQRQDGEHVDAILKRLLGKSTQDQPLILLAGSVIGSNKELYELHKSGDLAARVARVGVKMAPRLKKPKHHVFEERTEMERIRAPHAPVA